MSTTIQSCPGCKTLILADTYECPECGCVLDEKRKAAANDHTASELKSATLTERCPHCQVEVRIGLVRCWNCNGFMREDIARRYERMTSTPQPIIYSDVAPADRTDYMPARTGDDAQDFNSGIYDAEDDDFQLDEESPFSDSPEFELRDPPRSAASFAPTAQRTSDTAPPEATAPRGPDAPKSTTPSHSARADVSADKGSDSTDKPQPVAAQKDSPKADADELLSIAMQEQKEVSRRRQQRMAEQRAKRMLIPCRCGAWVRVHERQAGRTVRCRQCHQLINIPEIKKKTEKTSAQEASPVSRFDWIDDVWFHQLVPTSLVLKPGSLSEDKQLADLAFADNAVCLVCRAADATKKKKGLFGSAKPKNTEAERTAWREAVRQHVATTGALANAPQAELYRIEQERLPELRLVQPIIKVQESMFAGVPVFGEGRIAVFLPVELPEGKQAFCSMALTPFRKFQEKLAALAGHALPAEENGVPASERHESSLCHYTQAKVEFIRDLPYYQQDSAFELVLTGYRCTNCRIVVSEEGRKSNKLGGANGKGIAKAKCPKCGGKFGNEPLYKATAAALPAGADA